MKSRKRVGAALTGRSVLVRAAPHFVERSLTVSAVIATPGVGLVIAGGFLGSVAGVILASFGAILLTVALLSILYDAVLKDVLLGEVYDAMGISEQTRAVGLEQIVRNDDLDIEACLADGSAVTVLPLDPSTWQTAVWPIICDHAKRKSVAVRILLPAHDGDHVRGIAHRLGEKPADLSKILALLPDKLGDSWDAAGSALLRSTLEVWLYTAVPATGLLATDNRIVLEFPPALGYPVANRRGVCLVATRKATSSLLTDLIEDQLARIGYPEFSASISRPQPAAVTPDASIVVSSAGDLTDPMALGTAEAAQ